MNFKGISYLKWSYPPERIEKHIQGILCKIEGELNFLVNFFGKEKPKKTKDKGKKEKEKKRQENQKNEVIRRKGKDKKRKRKY